MILEKEYNQFDELLFRNGDEEEINELFTTILTKAIDILNEKVEADKFLEYPEDKYVIRALFDYLLELWSQEEYDEAKKLGYDLVLLVNDEVLKESFSLFILGLLEKLPIDKFLDNYVEEENSTDDYDMFFTDFKDEIDELIIKHVETFKKEFSE